MNKKYIAVAAVVAGTLSSVGQVGAQDLAQPWQRLSIDRAAQPGQRARVDQMAQTAQTSQLHPYARLTTNLPGPGDLQDSGLIEMGELGVKSSYEVRKNFWGDDSISQIGRRLSRPLTDVAKQALLDPKELRRLGNALISGAGVNPADNTIKR